MSLGALALVLCLALPMGVLSLFAPASTGDAVDAADTVVVARVVSMQHVAEEGATIVEFGVTRQVVGDGLPRMLTLTLPGRPSMEVGDLVVSLLTLDPPTIHGTYQVRKSEASLDYQVVTPITGMWSEGILDQPPVPLEQFLDAIAVRRGMAPPGASSDPAAEGSEGASFPLGFPADAYEPNDDLASATPVFIGPPTLITGMPTVITGLTITPGDVDYFAFDVPGLNLLHAETRVPAGVTALTLDTLLGAFHVPSGEFIDYNDDKDASMMSRLVTPLEQQRGPFAVAVESAPDPDLDFDGMEGTTVGAYELILELEKASYITNVADIIAGVSLDGTFIEDFEGFAEIGGMDVLLAGKPADAWGLSYDAQLPGGVSSIFSGGGDHLVPPVFNVDLQLVSFKLTPYVDSNGFNRNGGAEAVNFVLYQLLPRRGVSVTTHYAVPLNQRVVRGEVKLAVGADDPVTDLVYTRVMDVDLFGPGPDKFTWDFGPSDHYKIFPVDTTTNVGNVTIPPQRFGELVGDYQVAMVIELGDYPGGTFDELPFNQMVYTLVKEFVVEADAIAAATQNLIAENMRSWVIASDQDPDTGLYWAFGVGMHSRPPR